MGQGFLALPDAIAFLGVLATIGVTAHAYFQSKRPTHNEDSDCASAKDVEEVSKELGEHHIYTRDATHRILNALDTSVKSLAIIMDRMQRS